MSSGRHANGVFVNSRFTHLLERDGIICLLNSLTLRKLYGEQILRDVYELFREPMQITDVIRRLSPMYPVDLLKDITSDLRETGLIVANSNADACNYASRFASGMRQSTIRHMYFLPTSDCNFRCKYCFVEDKERCLSTESMSQSVAERGLEVFAKLTEQADEISIVFYGGEPLLNGDVLYSSMKYVRYLEEQGRFKRPVRMSLLTNGSLVNDSTVAAILETGAAVSVSIDGPEHLHDLSRVTVGGGATFRKALDGFRRLQAAGLKPGVSCTISPFTIGHIEEVTRFILEELSPQGMGFNVLLPGINEQWEGYSYELAAQQLITAFQILRDAGVYEDRVMRRVRPYLSNGFHLKDCMGVGGQIVLSPSGSIGPCQAFLGFDDYFPLAVGELHARLSSLSSEHIYQNPLFREWLHRFPLNMKECMDCFAIAVCGGGCPYASFVTKGSIWEVDERVCYQSKYILEWMIWDTYEQMSVGEGRPEVQQSLAGMR